MTDYLNLRNGSILMEPSIGSTFKNTNKGDLLLRGKNDDTSNSSENAQQIHIGVSRLQDNDRADKNAQMSVSEHKILANVADFHMSNSTSTIKFSHSNNQLSIGFSGKDSVGTEIDNTGLDKFSSNSYDEVLNVVGNARVQSNIIVGNDCHVLGKLYAHELDYQYSNITVFKTTEFQNDLTVDGGDIKIFSHSNGEYSASNSAKSIMTFSNFGENSNGVEVVQGGSVQLVNWSSNLGLNNNNPQYALDVTGSINFTGDIRQNGAIFSGWESNANGNYINSNAAFNGETTEHGIMSLYTVRDNGGSDIQLHMMFSNSYGSQTIDQGMSNRGNYLGVGESSPNANWHVNGNGIYSSNLGVGLSSFSNFSNVRHSDAKVSVLSDGEMYATGIISSEKVVYTPHVVSTKLYIASNDIEYSNDHYANSNNTPALITNIDDVNVFSNVILQPTIFNSLDIRTSNLYASGHASVNGSLYINEQMFAHETSLKRLNITGSDINNAEILATYVHDHSNYNVSNFGSSDLDVVLTSGKSVTSTLLCTSDSITTGNIYGFNNSILNEVSSKTIHIRGFNSNIHADGADNETEPSHVYPTEHLIYMASSNPGLSNVVLSVDGDVTIDGFMGVRNKMWVGETMYIGSNVNSNSYTPSTLTQMTGERLDLYVQDAAEFKNNVIFDKHVIGSNIILSEDQAKISTAITDAIPLYISYEGSNGVSFKSDGICLGKEFSVFSDRRIKTDIEYLNDPKNSVIDLKPCSFNYVDKMDDRKTGFIAQEVEEVLPECVRTVKGTIKINRLVDCVVKDGELVIKGLDELDTLEMLVLSKDMDSETSHKVIRSEDDLLIVELNDRDDLTEWTEVLVISAVVNNFKIINYEALTTLSVFALQSQTKRIDELESKLSKLI